jgi:gluconokinase
MTISRSNQPQIMAVAIVLMGVSGSGKTTIGKALSAQLGWPFFEGDQFHSPENVDKMAKGIPLTDQDRAPWLAALHDLIAGHLRAGTNMILACSALKARYRQQLREGNQGLFFVFLDGDFDLIWSRMRSREDHYMKPGMLKSQFDILEPPSDALKVGIDRPIKTILQEIIAFITEQDMD